MANLFCVRRQSAGGAGDIYQFPLVKCACSKIFVNYLNPPFAGL